MRQKFVRVMKQLNQSLTKSPLVNGALVDVSKSYKEAVRTLNNLQSNAAALEKVRQERDRLRNNNLPETIAFVNSVGVTLDDIDNLSVIHVSGTKGKGSTCAFTESILRAHGYKTGFYSSPHLVEVRERIRINGQPLSREAFSSYFWECYNKLQDNKESNGGKMPAYFRFLTVMAYMVFKCEKVDVAIMEVGIGGRFDCTNIVRKPVVCGVSSLGYDHVSLLGDTLDKIAWHKAGIFKEGVPAITSPQPDICLQVLKDCAKEVQAPLYVVQDEISSYGFDEHLGIQGQIQKINASLSVQLASAWMAKRKEGAPNLLREQPLLHPFQLDTKTKIGLESCSWPGRCQVLDLSDTTGITYFLDGAHTVESAKLCSDWFKRASAAQRHGKNSSATKRILLFNMTGDRDETQILENFVDCDFDYAVFCPNVATKETGLADQNNRTVTNASQMRTCRRNQQSWIQLMKAARHDVAATPLQSVAVTQTPVVIATDCDNHEKGEGAHSYVFETIEETLAWCTHQAGSLASSTTSSDPSRDAPVQCNGVHDVVHSDSVQVNGMADSVHANGSSSSVHTNSYSTAHNHGSNNSRIHVLCTGSIHLLGGVLRLLDSSTYCEG